MPKCTQCHKKITRLAYEGKHVIVANLSQDAWYTDKWERGVIDRTYACPKCSKLLFTDEDEAIKFMLLAD